MPTCAPILMVSYYPHDEASLHDGIREPVQCALYKIQPFRYECVQNV